MTVTSGGYGQGLHYRLLSEPIEILWAGWKSDTQRLQQAGWEISVEQDVLRCAQRIGLRHQGLQQYGMTTVNDFDYRADYYQNDGGMRRMERIRPFELQYMACRLQVNVMDDYSNFTAVDASPCVTSNVEIKDIEDFGIWALPMARSKEIIVDPHDVDQLLKMIADVQLPEQEAIRSRSKLRASREGTTVEYQPRHNFHAQILSIA